MAKKNDSSRALVPVSNSESILASPSARRRFLARLGVGAGVAAAGIAALPAMAQQVSPWRPARHAQDDWLEAPSAQHRFVFDATTPDGVALALQFASNYFLANENAYGLKDSDLAVLVILRHKGTSFGYNDVMWAKYGKYFSQQSGYTDPKTGEPPANNIYDSGKESRIAAMVARGVRFAVCQTATRGIISNAAKSTGLESEKIFNDLSANLVTNARLVPAGIVTVNRAQERGYSFAHAI